MRKGPAMVGCRSLLPRSSSTAPYLSGSTMNWRKLKCYQERELENIGMKARGRKAGDGAFR